MRAVVYSAYGEPPVVTTVPEPVAPDGGAVLEVRATGVCRSDWHAWRGHEPVPLPHTPGHELSGVVAEIGAGVTRWRPGDRVTVPFVCGCGACGYCRAGDAQVCPHQTQPGFTGPGSFAERVVVHAADTNLVALPGSVDFVTAASLGCRFATAYRALTAHGRLAEGDWLAVHGCGGLGLSAVQIGVALGARVIAVDIAPSALTLAAELGAAHTIDATSEPDPAAEVLALSGGGATVSIDALGSPGTAAASVRGLRRRGRHVQAGLLLDGPTPLPMDVVIAKELSIHGTHGMAAVDYPPLLALVADGTLRPDLLVGSVVGLDEAPAALTAMDHPPTGPGMTVVAIG
ncbi:MAG: zinc-dependent alcohol dehydrogenase family protein [Actinophytocola sp.]|uniref:zinc-dependent alcohol dehydrogenase family protein n=1 Tax=Actinophytocola sp. TaxID=1872138 RepID=UPI003C7368B5